MPILRFGTVTSTIDIARALAEGHSPTPLLVLADRQTAGRGRLGRAWQSPQGSISATLLIQGAARPGLGVLVGLAAIDAIADELAAVGAPCEPRLRWPNDVVLEEPDGPRKVAGCLVQILPIDNREYLLASVGVNVHNAASELGDTLRTPAIALSEITNHEVDPASLAGRLADGLAEAVTGSLTPALLDRLNSALARRREQVTVRTEQGECTGRALGIASCGGLRLERPDGTEQIVQSAAELVESPPTPGSNQTRA